MVTTYIVTIIAYRYNRILGLINKTFFSNLYYNSQLNHKMSHSRPSYLNMVGSFKDFL